MTEQEWNSRMEIAAASCISETACTVSSKRTGCWALVAFGMSDDVAVMTGTDSSKCPEITVETMLFYPWGPKSDLAAELGIPTEPDVFPETRPYADALLDRVIAGTWDKSRDSPPLQFDR